MRSVAGSKNLITISTFFWLFSELVPVLRKKNGMFFICRLEIRPFKGVDCPNDARFFNRGSLKNHDDSR
jgi:hypothetical protein